MTGALLPRSSGKATPSRGNAAVWSVGFRPFYIAAALFAATAVPLWIANYAGFLHFGSYLTGRAWHAHEMLFGFAPAVITGFLFTAVQNWTGQRLPHGYLLMGFVALWLAGRVTVLTGPAWLAIPFDLAFLPAVAIAIGIPIVHTRNFRNLFAVGVLLGLAAANALFHCAQLGHLPFAAEVTAIAVSFDVLTILMAVIGGRVVPMFTRNAVPDARPTRIPHIEFCALGLLFFLLVMDLLAPWLPALTKWTGVLATMAAIVHLIRLSLWAPLATWREPLLWILPLSYLWIPVALALKATTILGDVIPISVSFHALAVGAMGGLMIGMMSRSARGHTGRPLAAGRTETAMFLLIQAAALARILPLIVVPSLYFGGLILSASLWAVAFTLFAIRYWPVVTRPRI